MTNEDFMVSLHHVDGIGNRTILKLLEFYQDLKVLPEINHNMLQKQLKCSADLISGIMEAIKPDVIESVKKQLKDKNISYVSLIDSEYPSFLSEIANPPAILYGIGEFSLLHQPIIGIVGTRRPTNYGKMVAHKIAGQLVQKGWVIISGMAEGIDGEAHRGALSMGKASTIAVLGSGVDIVYPRGNKDLYREISKSGLILSEYPPGTQPRKGTFPLRNRIISGLPRGIVVVEAAARSGSFITADMALEQGRDVYAIPGPILSAKSSGPNRLIQQGAKLVTGINDILDEYPDVLVEHTDNQESITNFCSTDMLSKEEQSVLEIIQYTQIHIDDIIKSSKLPSGQIHTILLNLQVKNKIKQLPGLFFIKTSL